jgi:predicted Fe-Mo cluster-binding NifX family protein
MRIAVSAQGASPDAAVDPRFGRCPYFAIVDTASVTLEFVDNASSASNSGSGIQAAQLVAQHKVDAVLTGRCGANAQQTLAAAKIEIISDCSGTVTELVRQYVSGELTHGSSRAQPQEQK